MTTKNLKNLAAFAKKALAIAAICATTVPAFAEGYQINSQSARQAGMGHTGTALKLGAESMLFNPAGMVYMNSKFDVSFGLTGIASKVKFENESIKTESEHPMSTPIYFYLGYQPCSKLAVGISVTNPAGNAVQWPDSWAGATLVQKISLKAFNVQPTVSYKVNDNISLGAGLMIDFGNFSLNKGLVAANAFDALGGAMSQMTFLPAEIQQLSQGISTFKDQTPANIELSGNSKVSLGYNIGALFNVGKFSFGITYRSKVKLSVEKGDAEIIYANNNAKALVNTLGSLTKEQISGMLAALPYPDAQKEALATQISGQLAPIATLNRTAGVLNGANFKASLPIPSIFSIGATYYPNSKWTVTAEAQFTGWSAYESLDVQFDEKTGNYTLSTPKNYDNSFAIRAGAQHILTDFTTIRFGGYVDTTPVQQYNYNPETPGATTYCITAGATLKPLKYMAIDLTMAYLFGEKSWGSIEDSATGKAFAGDYKKTAFMPAVGLRFQF